MRCQRSSGFVRLFCISPSKCCCHSAFFDAGAEVCIRKRVCRLLPSASALEPLNNTTSFQLQGALQHDLHHHALWLRHLAIRITQQDPRVLGVKMSTGMSITQVYSILFRILSRNYFRSQCATCTRNCRFMHFLWYCPMAEQGVVNVLWIGDLLRIPQLFTVNCAVAPLPQLSQPITWMHPFWLQNRGLATSAASRNAGGWWCSSGHGWSLVRAVAGTASGQSGWGE